MYNTTGKLFNKKSAKAPLIKNLRKSLADQDKIKQAGRAVKGKGKAPASTTKKNFKYTDYFDQQAGPFGGFKGVTKK